VTTFNPFVYNITSNTEDSHQTDPGLMLTFIRWENRDPYHFDSSISGTRSPLVVINDCISLQVSYSKSSPAPTLQASLLGGDINYLTAIAPGDLVIANMKEWEGDIVSNVEIDGKVLPSLYDRAKAGQPINHQDDGFKGVFKVQSVHETFSIDTNGTKRIIYNITAHAFSELGNTIYFNPYLVSQGDLNNNIAFLTEISGKWNNLIKDKLLPSVQNLLVLLFQTFVGNGLNENGKKTKLGIPRTENNLYSVPQLLGSLLGNSKAKTAADLYNIFIGIQNFKQESYGAYDFRNFCPPKSSFKKDGRFYSLGSPLQGRSITKPEYWNQVKVWDILNQYLNNIINEMYVCFKADPDTGFIMPTLVARQKPFTNSTFTAYKDVTFFHSLPRWKLWPERTRGVHLGRDEALRINFVQVFGRSEAISSNANVGYQIVQGNYVVDKEDIQRNGLRPFIATSPFDYPADASKAQSATMAPIWAKILGDFLIGGHLKMSGTIECSGIEEPIQPGDNLEFEGNVYHIESVSHSMEVTATRTKIFKTILNLSMGLSSDTSSSKVAYSEMKYTDADSKRALEDPSSIRPGVSDSQYLPGASNRAQSTEKTNKNQEASFEGSNLPNKKKETRLKTKGKKRV
jgi:hypothetical protein